MLAGGNQLCVLFLLSFLLFLCFEQLLVVAPASACVFCLVGYCPQHVFHLVGSTNYIIIVLFLLMLCLGFTSAAGGGWCLCVLFGWLFLLFIIIVFLNF